MSGEFTRRVVRMSENNTGPEKNKENNDSAQEKKSNFSMASGLETLVLVPQLGLTIAIPIVLGSAGGHWIDEKLGTGMVFSLILLLFGIAGGIYGAYNLITVISKKKKGD